MVSLKFAQQTINNFDFIKTIVYEVSISFKVHINNILKKLPINRTEFGKKKPLKL